MRAVVKLLATGFGLGYSPVASGTTGALLGVPIVWALSTLSLSWQIGVAVALVVIAIPVCDVGEGIFGKKDDGHIVADEYMTFPLCLLGIPWMQHPWLLGVAFVLSRLMDIIKPPPARQSQELTGGLGIVTDDALSNLYTLLLMHVIVYFAL